MAYPSVVSTYTDPQPTDRMNAPSHSSIESAQNTGLEEIQTFVGTLSSAVGTLVYDIRATASDGGGHTQTAVKGGTGQTTYTKGDLLVATNASTLSKFAVGANNLVLVADSNEASGMRWGSGNQMPTYRVFPAASTIGWLKPAGLSYVRVKVQGAGGGGDGHANGGGGGGGGGYGEGVIPASVLNSSETMVIGSKGLTASIGGVSRFGTHIVSEGGQPGVGQSGGRPGSVSGAYATIVNSVMSGTSGGTDSGSGADAPFGLGQGGDAGGNTQGGQPATGFGSAGGGGTNGAPGAGGIIIIEEY